jgi:hypothetical protein
MRTQKAKYLISIKDSVEINSPEFISVDKLLSTNSLEISSEPLSLGKQYVTKKTKIVVTVDDSFTEDDFDFADKEIVFHNAKDPQILLIDTSELKKIGLFDGMAITMPDQNYHKYLPEIHVDDGSTSPKPYKIGYLFTINANQLLLPFEIPPGGPLFKFYLALKLSGRVGVFNCDPQIGHDPK